MPASKVQNHQELIDWITEGKSYPWIIATYIEKYDIELKPAMLSNFRRRNGIPLRVARDDKLIPWKVEESHRSAYLLEMLRLEARLRQDAPMSAREAERLASFKENLAAADAVVHYDPDKGFSYAPRREQDTDLIREPAAKTKTTRWATNAP